MRIATVAFALFVLFFALSAIASPLTVQVVMMPGWLQAATVDQSGNRYGLLISEFLLRSQGDTTPPDTTITGGPTGTVASTSATFTFTSTEAGSTFQCRIRYRNFCGCPASYTGLSQGSHTFQVRATDAAGRCGRYACITNVDGRHGGAKHDDEHWAKWDGRFHICNIYIYVDRGWIDIPIRVDTGTFHACPASYTGLSQGSHTFQVRSTDAAGNTDATPASRTWTVDTVAPDTTILTGPSGTVASTSATFTFSSNEGGSTFQCALDAGTFGSARRVTPDCLKAHIHSKCDRSMLPVMRTLRLHHERGRSTLWLRIRRSLAGQVGQSHRHLQHLRLHRRTPDRHSNALSTQEFLALVLRATPDWLKAHTRFKSVRPILPGTRMLHLRQEHGPSTLWLLKRRSRVGQMGRSLPHLQHLHIRRQRLDRHFNARSTQEFLAPVRRVTPDCLKAHIRFKSVRPMLSGIRMLHLRQEHGRSTLRRLIRRSRVGRLVRSLPHLQHLHLHRPKLDRHSNCALDAGISSSCPAGYTGLSQGLHTFQVRSVDAAGNADATPASRTWTVDTVAPDTTITGGPSGTVASTSASFTFSSNEAGATFQCGRPRRNF